MAMSLRAKLMLPFEVTSMVWKGICGEPLTIEDLRSIDAITVQLITAIKDCEQADPQSLPVTYLTPSMAINCIGLIMVVTE